MPQSGNTPIDLHRKLTRTENQVLALAAGFTPTKRNPQELYLNCIHQLKEAAVKQGVYASRLPTVNMWFENMENYVLENVPNRLDWSEMNLTHAQTKAIANFKNDPDVVVRIADKGMGLVAMSTNWYNAQVKSHLEAKQYRKVRKFTRTQILEYNSLIQKGRDVRLLLMEDLKKIDFWKRREAKPCPFYILPKIHKQPVKSRPIAAATKYYSKPMARWVADELNEMLERHQDEVVINSLQVIHTLEKLKLAPECLILTYDVEALYPSIDKAHCLQLVEAFVRQNAHYNSDKLRIFIKMLRFLLLYHYVQFQDEIYLQVDGIATGASFAPPLANIYLLQLWKPVWEKYEPHLALENRYIDDGLVIFKPTMTKDMVKGLVADLNQAHPNINITHEISERNCIFLDIYIYKGQRFLRDRILDTQVYFKPTNKFLWLNAKSSHPPSLLNGVMIGELTRYIRLCSDKTAFNMAKTMLWHSLLRRGYEPDRVKKVFGRVKYKDRKLKLQITEKRGPPRTKGQKVLSNYQPIFDQITWRNVVGYGKELTFYEYSQLRQASMESQKNGFARPGRILYRKGDKLRFML